MMKIKNAFKKHSNQQNSLAKAEIKEEQPQNLDVSKEDEKDPIFEDFALKDTTPPENVRDVLSTSRHPFRTSTNMTRMTNTQPSFFNDDDDEEDDDFADIEKSYQDFLARRKNENGGTNRHRSPSFNKTHLNKRKQEYTIEDFQHDFFEENKDIQELLKKMPVELKDLLLKTLLSRKSK